MAFCSSVPVQQNPLSSLKRDTLLDLQKVANSAAPQVVYQKSEKKLHHGNKQGIWLFSHLFANEKT